MKKHKMKKHTLHLHHSIRMKLSLMLVLCMGTCMFVTWMMNRIFLENFYVTNVKSRLVSTYDKINDLLDDVDDKDINDTLSSEFYTNSNIDVLVAHSENGIPTLDYSTNRYNPKTLERFLRMFALLAGQEGSENSQWSTDNDFSEKDKSKEKAVTNYAIQKYYDKMQESYYFTLLGELDNNHYIMIIAPLESIRESASISNQFLAYVGLVLTFIGSLIMFYISSSFSKPIRNMAAIAKKMSALDFNAKVSYNNDNEIGELGQSMNHLSSQLEETISDLKTANNELRNDIENKIQIDEMRKEFLSHVSHELKTPIALIQGYAEGLKDNILDDEESKDFYCDVIIDEADKMNHMVKKLLSLNEIEFGNEPIQFQHFNITELIQNIISQSEILIQKAQCKIEVDFSEQLDVWADEFRIEEVFSNYFTNALNHVYPNGTVRVSYEQHDHDVRIFVYNDGDPLPEEELEKLWIKFYKVDKARTREYGGSGIGLSIVAATMKAHGKNFGVENYENGVRFFFDLDTENNPITFTKELETSVEQ